MLTDIPLSDVLYIKFRTKKCYEKVPLCEVMDGFVAEQTDVHIHMKKTDASVGHKLTRSDFKVQIAAAFAVSPIEIQDFGIQMGGEYPQQDVEQLIEKYS